MQYINVDIMFGYYTYFCFLKNMIRQNSNTKKYLAELFSPI